MALDYHAAILADPAFQTFMRGIIPDWDNMTFESQRFYAKTWSFARAYGLDHSLLIEYLQRD